MTDSPVLSIPRRHQLLEPVGEAADEEAPAVLRRIGADPAASSTPMVATIVDVTGVTIYLSVATMILR